MRVEAETARSRFTEEEAEREPRFVRRRVSGETPTVKWVGVVVEVSSAVSEVMVRQVPFMEMESPRWASVRRGVQEVMVRVVPVVGEVSRVLMAGLG